MPYIEHRPGEQAPGTGLYEERNVFGAATGTMIFMTEGDEFPPAPRGFTWRLLSDRPIEELRAKAAEYRRMAETATTEDVRTALQRIAERLDEMADRRKLEARSKC